MKAIKQHRRIVSFFLVQVLIAGITGIPKVVAFPSFLEPLVSIASPQPHHEFLKDSATGIKSQTSTFGPDTSMEEYMDSLGIPIESHFATTEDGYILRMHRLAQSRNASVIFLQHGILASSWCWVANEPRRSLGIVLWKLGYEVWLGNNRGNVFSRNHTLFETNTKEFWNFTFADMPHDLHAQLRYVIQHTKRQRLSYIGWSQANTQMLVAGTKFKATIGKFLRRHINLWVALSPVAYLKHSTSPLLKIVANMDLGELVERVFPFGFLTGGKFLFFCYSIPIELISGSKQLHAFEDLLCEATLGEVCKFTSDIICGQSSKDSRHSIERYAAHFPSGTSMKDLNHFEQLMDLGIFRDYSYGRRMNKVIYNNEFPPIINISDFVVGIPVAFFRGSHDDLVQSEDFIRFTKEFPPENVVSQKLYQGYSHLTWLAGSDEAYLEWGTDITALITKHNPLPDLDL